MNPRIDIRIGYDGEAQPSDGFKVVQQPDESKDDFIERIIGKLYEGLDQLEEGENDG